MRMIYIFSYVYALMCILFVCTYRMLHAMHVCVADLFLGFIYFVGCMCFFLGCVCVSFLDVCVFLSWMYVCFFLGCVCVFLSWMYVCFFLGVMRVAGVMCPGHT